MRSECDTTTPCALACGRSGLHRGDPRSGDAAPAGGAPKAPAANCVADWALIVVASLAPATWDALSRPSSQCSQQRPPGNGSEHKGRAAGTNPKSASGMLANHWPVPPLLPHRAPEAWRASLRITERKGCPYRGLVLPQGTARESWGGRSGFERPRSRNHGLCRCLPASPTLPEHQREPCPTSVADTGTACWAYSSQGMALTLEARQGPPFIFRSAASWAGTVTHFRCLLGRVRLSRGLGIARFTLARLAISFPRGSLSPIVQTETH